jgi:sec-independent protein translocase protein TatC
MESIARELTELKWLILRTLGLLALVFAALLTLSPGDTRIVGIPVPVFAPGGPSLAAELFRMAKDTLVPEGVPVVALGPVSSFIAPMLVAFLVALLVVFPYGLSVAARYLRPALAPAERRLLSAILWPALFLFYIGAALAYFVILPRTYDILYSFSAPMGVAPMFALDEFVTSVFLLTLSVGAIFLLPVVMAVLTRSGLVSRSFWLRHWRGAVFAALLFSAVVTPDGSGVTMAFLSVPLVALYGVGAAVRLPGTPAPHPVY